MGYLLIDGYNLLGIFHKDLEKARDGLIERLVRYAGLLGHDIIIVFDGWKNGQPVETRSRIGAVTVIYSRLGEKADAVMKRIMREEKRQWVVISSDKEVSDFAWSMGYAPILSHEFDKRLELSMAARQYAGGDISDDYEDGANYKKKGNPRQLSKREKLRRRALQRL